MPKRKHPHKTLSRIIVLLAVVIPSVTLTGANVLISGVRTVVIYDNSERIELKTREVDVDEILEEANVEIGEKDYINFDSDEINIKRAIPVKLVLADETKEVLTVMKTVREVLEENGIQISTLDMVRNNITGNVISMYKDITENMEIRFIRISEEIIEEDTILPYKSITKENADLYSGKTQTVQEGQTGKMVSTYNATYEDGEVVRKKLLEEEVVSKPVDEIKELGIMPTFTTSRGSYEGYSKSMILEATAYSASTVAGKYPGHPTYGITASGVRAKVGMVAVDKSVIPLGTKMYVESLDSTKEYGYCIATDTGVDGKRIDLYFNTGTECYKFGRRDVKVYILKDQSVDIYELRAGSN